MTDDTLVVGDVIRFTHYFTKETNDYTVVEGESKIEGHVLVKGHDPLEVHLGDFPARRSYYSGNWSVLSKEDE